ncbi:NADH pyrophosphatase [Corynebacterium yudongzhengii]|uniref:NAD(+) diphosphatase n=1 Tax=Corynebacterium yudongzhengii TaxID=2080740 RepID=A0A2U1T4Z4_9CORY|nr:NUDIX domain-containing protein [Corynebacterium yudongzhengii]AWB81428.1 NADH pyrophosphatase [Corynebacterium yudongzhengii]PWC01074.1 NUDIX domain-containing protein [Corynebacterium yudongzhengii]
MSNTARDLVLISPEGYILTDHGRPTTGQLPVDPGRLIRVDENTWAVRLTDREDAELRDAGLVHTAARSLLDDRRIARALALVDNRERVLFDPRDGSPVSFDADNIVARGEGGPIFPRIDPAVIGLITDPDDEYLLLGRKAGGEYYSLIAGYVEAGENLEEAFYREAFEETGRRIRNIIYRGSQPWPMGGSLMVGFEAITDDRDPQAATDGELDDVRWTDRPGLDNVPLAGPGSIARSLIDDWRNRTNEATNES